MVLVLALLSATAHAWGYHYLVTARALEKSDEASRTVRAESLEHFLGAEMPALQKTFGEYYDWLEGRGAKRFARMTLDQPTREGFLRAGRLNPNANVALVVRRLPGEPAGAEPLAAISPYLKETPPFVYSFDAVTEGQPVEARQVVWTASDEPDWGFDHELWPFTEYGYGEQPFGKPKRRVNPRRRPSTCSSRTRTSSCGKPRPSCSTAWSSRSIGRMKGACAGHRCPIRIANGAIDAPAACAGGP
jgi:hypothetical protein